MGNEVAVIRDYDIRDRKLVDATAQSTINSTDAIEMKTIDGNQVFIDKASFIKAVGQAFTASDPKTFTKLLGMNGDGPMGIGASDLASVLGVPPLTTLACGNGGKMIKFKNSTWITAIFSTGSNGWHTIDPGYVYSTYIAEIYSSNAYYVCYAKVYMGPDNGNPHIMANDGAHISLKYYRNRLAIIPVDARQGMTIKITCFNAGDRDVNVNYGTDVSSWTDVTYPTT